MGDGAGRPCDILKEMDKIAMNEIERTLAYYETHADDFVKDTGEVSFSALQEDFSSRISDKGRILDLGCGSGRDSEAFLAKGFQVVAIDGSQELCRLASKRIGQPVIHTMFQSYEPDGMFDGIWACASLLHLPVSEIRDVMEKLVSHLRVGGCFYLSFKYGTFSGMRNGRYFTDMTEDRFQKLLQDMAGFRNIKMYQTEDVRPNRKGERWPNVILERCV